MKHRQARLRKWKLAHWVALTLVIFCLLAAGWLMVQADIPWSTPQQWVRHLQDLGWIGVVAFISFLAIAIVIGPIPSTPFTIASGTVWGPMHAGLYGIIGIFLGSILAYFIGRTLGRSAVKALTGKVIHLSTHRGHWYVGWVVIVTHLIPIMPYELISYGAGMSGLSFSMFSVTCALGIIPSTLLLTHMGEALALNLPVALAIAFILFAIVGTFAWGVKRHNWLGIKDIVVFQ